MSANFPPRHSVNLTPRQQAALQKELDAYGVHIDPKELKTMTMDQLKKRLLKAGKPEAFNAIEKMMRSMSGDKSSFVQSTGKIKLPPGVDKKLMQLFQKKFPKEATMKMQGLLAQLTKAFPDGEVPSPAALRKEIQSYLEKQHIPQSEAKSLAENVVQGEAEGGYGSSSSGGAETE